MSQSKAIKKYTETYRNFVQLERKAEMDKHYEEIQRLSPEARQKKGRALLHLKGKDAGRGLGGTYLVRFSPGQKLPELEISVGDLVIVTPAKKPSGKEPSGTVTGFTNFSVTVAFNNKPPAWMGKKGLRLDLFVNDITYQRMLEAIKASAKHPVLPEILTGATPIIPPEVKGETFSPSLNEAQNKSIARAISAQNFHLLHGPPGTGKTTTIAECIRQHCSMGDKILTTADSNTAVDNLVEKLLELNISVVRTGHPARTSEHLLDHSLDYKVQFEDDFKEAETLRNQIDKIKEQQKELIPATPQFRRGLRDEQIRQLAAEGKSMRGIPGNKILQMKEWLELQEEVSEAISKAEELEKKAVNNILSNAQVVCSTNSGAGSNIINDYLNDHQKMFDLAVVDEATQSTEPACLIPLVKANRFYLAGDHKQLPPTVLHQEAEQALQFSLFERLLDMYGTDIKSLLTRQYRMHEKIMEFPSQTFYENALEADPSIAGHTLKDLLPANFSAESLSTPEQKAIDPDLPSVFFSTENLPDKHDRQRKGAFSRYNKTEATVVLKFTALFQKAGLKQEQIGIISPYIDQTKLIKEKLSEEFKPEVKTVDGFQGREKEVIIISFVRSNDRHKLGFLSDLRRLNVAITRPRRKLIMIGDAPHLSTNKTFEALINSVPLEKLPM